MTATDIDIEDTVAVGELLRSARERARRTRADVAQELGIHPNRLQQIEQGYVTRFAERTRAFAEPTKVPTRATRDLLAQICNVLRVPADTAEVIFRRSGYAPLSEDREYLYVTGLTAEQMADLRSRAEKYRQR